MRTTTVVQRVLILGCLPVLLCGPTADAGDRYADVVVGIPKEDIELLSGDTIDSCGGVGIVPGAAAGITGTGSVFLDQSTPYVDDVAEEYDEFGKVLAVGDFNGDLLADFVVGIPDENVGSDITGLGAGMVHVFYGTRDGSIDDAVFHQESAGVAGSSYLYDAFGAALAVGDFDGDGYHDLAIGIPGKDVAGEDDAGALVVLFGSHTGLVAPNWAEPLSQGATGVAGNPEYDDRFGAALAAGDFNGDGFDDLAVGAPDEDISETDAGIVNVLYGSSTGLSTDGDVLLTPGGLYGAIHEGPSYSFGEALSVGDYDGDGFDDLAISSPGFSYMAEDAGEVYIVYGEAGGLGTTAGNRTAFPQCYGDPSGAECEVGDLFGSALTTGDFNGDGFDDLAVGAPFEDVAFQDNAGMVHIFYGSTFAIPYEDAYDILYQSQAGLTGISEDGDLFGWSLAAGDLNDDGYDDLLVGVPSEDFNPGTGMLVDAGSVHIIFGSAGGISTIDTALSEDYPDVSGVAEDGDRYGTAVAVLPDYGIFAGRFEGGDTGEWSSATP